MFWQKIKSGINAIIEFGQKLFTKIFLEATGETKDKKFRFFFMSSSIAILFFIIFILIGRNPFELLIPFTFYDMPTIDKRKTVTLYLSDGKTNLLKSKRKVILVENDIKKNLNILIGELSQPPYDDVIESNEENVFPKKLPDLRSPIIVMWLLDSNKKLMIDLNETTIQKELSSIRIRLESNDESIFDSKSTEEKSQKTKREEEIQVARLKILNTALMGLEKTIFENFPMIQSIEFKINGYTKEFPGLEYNLTEPKKRS